MKREKILVIGAGIGGLASAIALRRFGLDVAVYERASEMRGAGTGLSINSNAITALRSIDIDLGLEKRGQVVEQFRIMNHRGNLIREQPIGELSARVGAPSVSISRSDLQRALLDAAEGVDLTLGAAMTRYTQDESGVTAHFEDGTEARGGLLIGADGFNSVARRQIVGPEDVREAGYICWLAITDFTHPRLKPGYVGHYWGSGQRFGIVDIGGGRTYWWGTKNMPATHSHHWTGGTEEILGIFDGWADEIQEMIRRTPEKSIRHVPARDRPFLERWGDGRVTLLGDAAHPMLTSLAMGSAMAVEDAVVLASTLVEATDSSPQALRAYESRRLERTRMMVEKARLMSAMEQLESPVQRLIRNSYLRLVPKSVLIRSNEEAMSFTTPAA